MKHVAIIEGVSGRTRFLAAHHEVNERKEAKRFPSAGAATKAAAAHIESFPACVARHMKFTVEPCRADQVAG
jgi:hypothetical protein